MLIRAARTPGVRPASGSGERRGGRAAGQVYVADWYDPGVGGHAARDREAYGRIPRVAPRGSDRSPAGATDLTSLGGAVDALRSPVVSVRVAARQPAFRTRPAARALAAAIGDVREQREEGEAAALARRQFVARSRGPGPGNPAAARRAVRWSGLADADAAQVPHGERRGRLEADDEPRPGGRSSARPSRDAARRAHAGDAFLLETIDALDPEDPWMIETIGQVLEGDAENAYAELPPTTATRLSWSRPRPSPGACTPSAVTALAARAMARSSTPGRGAASSMPSPSRLVGGGRGGPCGFDWGPRTPRLRDLVAENRATNDWREYGLEPRSGGMAAATLAFETDVMKRGRELVDVDVAGASTCG